VSFTIEIGKCEADANPSFADIKIYHRECGGGRVETERLGHIVSGDLMLLCRRCHDSCIVERSEELNARNRMTQTALDGETRQVSVKSEDGQAFSASIVQRAEEAEAEVTPGTLKIDF
jgi:hypothetical protein